MTLTVTFKLGTDLDTAQVLVQNRVAIAMPRLPEEVRRARRHHAQELARPDDGRAHALARRAATTSSTSRNYALLRVRDELAAARRRRRHHASSARASIRCASGSIPRSCRAYGLTAGDVVRALQEQNVQVVRRRARPAAGCRADNAFQLVVTTQGRFEDLRQFRDVIVQARRRGPAHPRCRTWRASSSARATTSPTATSTASRRSALGIFQRPGTNALAAADGDHRARWTSSSSDFPPGSTTDRLQPDRVHRRVGRRGLQDAVRGDRCSSSSSSRLPAVLARRRSSRSSRSRSR